MSAAPDIFLSYTREDQATAQRFAEAFEAEGFSVWWDVTLRSGEAYDEVTEEALRTARAVVVLWSKKSVKSRWVRAEATLAERNRTLTPARIEACDLPVMFELTQTAELSHWKGQADDKPWLVYLDDLRRKIGGGPEAEAARVVESPGTRAASSRTGPAVVAMLPLAHRAGDEEMEFFAESLTEEITRELGQNSLVEVVPAGTMAAWRSGAVDYRRIGRELGVNYLIEGKLQRASEDVRLTAQLVDASTGRMVKSIRLSRELSDIETTPEQFPLEAAAQLGETVVQIEMDRAMNKPGPYLGWEHVLRASAYLYRTSSDGTRMAIDEARRAVTSSPDLGLAHALLAATLSVPVTTTGEKLDDSLRMEIQTHARRAMQLDGNNPAVIELLGHANSALDDREANLRLAKRLIELRPNSPTSHFRLGMAYLGLGRGADAFAALTDYERLSRFDSNRPTALFGLGTCHFLEGRTAEAEAAFDRALALFPDFNMALLWKAIVAASRGEEPRAIGVLRRFKQVEPGKSLEQAVRHVSRLWHERSTEAQAILRRLWEATDGVA
jgi:TolB-like protein